MADFDPEKFEDKYVHYFSELQRAYKNAFEEMNERFDSDLVHGIDQFVLNESEPFYDEIEGFSVRVPDEPYERIRGAVLVGEEKFQHVLDRFVEKIEEELHDIFEV
ncbi:MAG: DUF5783 family protein [Halobacteriales archaeon]